MAASHMKQTGPDEKPYEPRHSRAEEARGYAERRVKQESRRRRHIAAFIIAAVAVALCVVAAGHGLMKNVGKQPEEQNTTAAEEQTTDETEDTSEDSTGLPNDGRIVMTLAGSADTYVKRGESYIEGGCYAHDATDGQITDKVTASGTVDAQTAGDYTITYTVSDSAGYVATATRTVHVVDEVDGGWDTDGIAVFMYHDVYDPANPPEGATTNQNMISTTSLDEQLQWLNDHSYYYPSWAELAAYIEGKHSLPERSCVLTFDDGTQGFLNLAIPELEKHKIPATSFLICSDADIQDKLWQHASPYVVFQSHSFDMHRAGYTQKGHGGRIFDMSEEDIVADLDRSAQILKTKDAFAYPFGDVSDIAPEAVRDAGFQLAFTTQYGLVQPGDDPMQLKRMRIFGTYGLDSFTGVI
jgi:peptidoglycan/xylan/chitin deacetylase (PgdA/CDA1 family)